MALELEVINMGTGTDSRTGDPPYIALAKAKRNFQALEDQVNLAEGPQGPAAWSAPVAWATGLECLVGPPATVVTYDGSTYVTTTEHTAGVSFDGTKFVQVSAKGDQGDPGNPFLSHARGATPSGYLTIGAERFAHDYTYGDNGTVVTSGGNLFLGEDAGNLTLGATATQTYEASGNTGIGYFSMQSLTTGYENTGVGGASLQYATTAQRATGVGHSAAVALTTGNDVTAVGASALAASVTASESTAVGSRALFAATASGNTGVGYRAGETVTTGARNTFVGHQAGYGTGQAVDITGSTAIGAGAVAALSNQIVLGTTDIVQTRIHGVLQWAMVGTEVALARPFPLLGSYYLCGAGNDTTTGGGNIGIGYQTLAAVTSSVDCTAIGHQALQNLTGGIAPNTPTGNTAMGRLSQNKSVTGTNNTSYGDSTLRDTLSSSNCAFGYTTMQNNTTGARNNAFGQGAGRSCFTGNDNIWIGYSAGGTESNTGAAATSMNMAIGNESLLTATGSTLIGIGHQALYQSTGSYNVTLGHYSGFSVTSGAGNTFIGDSAGNSGGGGGTQLASANFGVAIGRGCVTTGHYGIAIGHRVAAAANQAVLGSTDITETVLRGHVVLAEKTAPSGTADQAKIYAVDNGSGKTKLMVIFGSGAAQQLAIEP